MKLKSTYFFNSLSLIALALILGLSSCRKDQDILSGNEVKLSFSTDTVLFDTIFTTLGSTTERLMVYNKGSQKVSIDQIALARGSQSQFRINVDGVPGRNFTNVEIPAKDSIFIFVEVTVDPNSTNTPFVIQDSIIFKTGDGLQDIDLVAWGQDAHFVVADQIVLGSVPAKIVAHEGDDITWTNDKPWVVVGYAAVDSNAILRMQPGTQVHFYNNSGMLIYRGGQLLVNGELNNEVVFQGTRLDDQYKEIPGQWDRIWIMESDKNSVFNYAIVKNAFIGIQAETIGNTPLGGQLELKNTQIYNSSFAGIFTRYYKIKAENTVLGNSGSYNMFLAAGGDYTFHHCTFANYWSYGTRQTPSVYISNYFKSPNSPTLVGDLSKAEFINSVIYGSNEEEIILDNDQSLSTDFNYYFERVLLRSQSLKNSDPNITDCLLNQDAQFRNTSENDYRPSQSSPMINAGTPAVFIQQDIMGIFRDAQPDLGAYEYLE